MFKFMHLCLFYDIYVYSIHDTKKLLQKKNRISLKSLCVLDGLILLARGNVEQFTVNSDVSLIDFMLPDGDLSSAS